VADYRVIQHINTVLCDRVQEICDGLELNWVGIHKDLDTQPKDDEEATIYVALYRVDDMDELNMPAWAVKPMTRGPAPPDEKRQDLLQIPPRFFYLYFILFVESQDPDLSHSLLGALMNGFHQEPTLLYRPVPYELNGKLFDSTGRPMTQEGMDYIREPTAAPIPKSNPKVAMERVSIALVDDLAFGDACLLLKGFDRKVRPYLCYRAFAKIDQPLELHKKVGGVSMSLFDQEPGEAAKAPRDS
jgi:hypothetical protein